MPSRAASRLSRARRVRRHKEGGGRAPGRGEKGGATRRPAGRPAAPGSAWPGCRRGPAAGPWPAVRRAGLALQPLESELDLPAQTVEGHDPLDRPGGGIERGQQHQPVGRAALLDGGGAAALPGLLVDPRPAFGSTAGRPPHEDQPARVPAVARPGSRTGRSSRSGRSGRRSTPFKVTRAPVESRKALLLRP